MRDLIEIDFNEAQKTPYECGRLGEHNAQPMSVTPPEELDGADYYRVVFDDGMNPVYSGQLTAAPFAFTLAQEITEKSPVKMWVEGYKSDASYIGKSRAATLVFGGPRASGEPSLQDTEPRGLLLELLAAKDLANGAAGDATDAALLANGKAELADTATGFANAATEAAGTATGHANEAAQAATEAAGLANSATDLANGAAQSAIEHLATFEDVQQAITDAETAKDNANTATAECDMAKAAAESAVSGAATLLTDVTSLNLFDKVSALAQTNDYATGKYVKYNNPNGGTLVTSSVRSVTGFMVCIPGDVFKTTSATKAMMAFYDASKVFVSGLNAGWTTCTVPAGCAYARFSYEQTEINTLMITKNQELPVQYQPYLNYMLPKNQLNNNSVDREMIVQGAVTSGKIYDTTVENIFDIGKEIAANVLVGSQIQSTGAFNAVIKYHISYKIPVSTNTAYVTNATYTQNAIGVRYVYNQMCFDEYDMPIPSTYILYYTTTSTLKAIASIEDYGTTVAGAVKVNFTTAHAWGEAGTILSSFKIQDTVNYNATNYTAVVIDSTSVYVTATFIATETGNAVKYQHTSTRFTTPSNAAYVRFTYYDNLSVPFGTIYLPNLMYVPSTTLPETYASFGAKINWLKLKAGAVNTAELVDSAVTEDKIASNSVSGVKLKSSSVASYNISPEILLPKHLAETSNGNFFNIANENAANVIIGKAYIANDGVQMNSSTLHIGAKIPLLPSTQYTMNSHYEAAGTVGTNTYVKGVYSITFFDRNDVSINASYINTNHAGVLFDTFTTASNCDYCRLTLSTGEIRTDYLLGLMLVKGTDLPTTYVPYGVEIDWINPTQKMKEAAGTALTRFNGKTLLTIGDSMTHGRMANGFTAKPRWCDVVAQNLGLNIINPAIVGATCRDTGSGNRWSTDWETILANYTITTVDYISIYLGANDGELAGTQNIGTTASTDRVTFCGALKNLIQDLINEYPTAQIFCITPTHPVPLTVQAIIDVCEFMKVPYYDLHNKGGLNITFTGGNAGADIIESVNAYYNTYYNPGDGVTGHWTQAGHTRVGQMITSWMQGNLG